MTSPEISPEAEAKFVALASRNLTEEFADSVNSLARHPDAAAYLAGLAEGMLKIVIVGGRFRILPVDTAEEATDADAEYFGFYM
ncbi:hypothetical protein O3Q52_16675 [Streptomyces sp. ActVer]|uniref:hypothetical protein n=1 Tax=Streptomyces sp. ActVer TaxID=3014558 RepID=UPI0022B52899|nr:hypothetical protein [Streptomyces sp. ActVer]MCZ4509801.1 hypothetical protein [Streptomyces sp. ActVer]